MQPNGSTTETGPAVALPQGGIPAEPQAVRAQLERLLVSPQFRNSKRCTALLKYVVEAYLEGALDRVKERNIGAEVFHRDAGYDTNQDSIVRTTAAEVRKRLAQYYLDPGHEDELRLSLPPGCYVPEFHPPVPSAPQPLVTAGDQVTPARRRRNLRTYWPIVPLAILAASGIWWWRTPPPALESFWKPLIEDRADALICIEQPLKIYRIEGPRFEELNDKMVGNGSTKPATEQVLDSTTLKLSDLRLAGSQYFSLGDLMVSVRLSEFLAHNRKPFQVLGDRVATYHDLRGRPAILIGQFNNRWTLSLTAGLRYYLDRDTARRIYQVHDRQNQGQVIASAPQSSSRLEEYAIVSRVLNPATEKMVVTLMGMTQQGTIAGGDFLTDARYMQDAFRKAPAGWYRKNLQVVLRTAMVGGTAGPPEVIAACYW